MVGSEKTGVSDQMNDKLNLDSEPHHMRRSFSPSIKRLVGTVLLVVACANPVLAQKKQHALDEMSLERWAKLREVERHQMQIAEKYYRKKNWTVAAAEYDKYLNLYEASDGAPYALLKWSLCSVNLRKQNTAIDDGFRSVIDYWPDSEEALAAGYYIGKTLKDIGQTKKAKPALAKVVQQNAKHIASTYSLVALADIAGVEKDVDAQVKYWHKLTFDAPRLRSTKNHCIDASVRLASYLLAEGRLDQAVKALDTTYAENQLSEQVVQRATGTLRQLVAKDESQSKGHRLADQLIAYLKEQLPDDQTSETGQASAKSIWYLVASVESNAKRDEKVLAVYNDMAKKFGTDDELLGKIGAWHESKEKYDAARTVYRKFKDEIVGLSKIAMTYRAEKKLESAISTYNKLASVDEDKPTRWKAESGKTYREFKKYVEAVAVYQELMTEDIENSATWLWAIATTYREAGKWKEAIGFYRQSDRFPDNYREMAACSRHLKQYDEAVVMYKQIAGGHKALAPWSLLQVGYTFEQAGKKDKAIAAFKQVCKLFPKDRHASTAHAHLQNKYKLSVTLGGSKDN